MKYMPGCSCPSRPSLPLHHSRSFLNNGRLFLFFFSSRWEVYHCDRKICAFFFLNITHGLIEAALGQWHCAQRHCVQRRRRRLPSIGRMPPYLSTEQPLLNFCLNEAPKVVIVTLLQWPLDGRSKNLTGASQEDSSSIQCLLFNPLLVH